MLLRILYSLMFFFSLFLGIKGSELVGKRTLFKAVKMQYIHPFNHSTFISAWILTRTQSFLFLSKGKQSICDVARTLQIVRTHSASVFLDCFVSFRSGLNTSWGFVQLNEEKQINQRLARVCWLWVRGVVFWQMCARNFPSSLDLQESWWCCIYLSKEGMFAFFWCHGTGCLKLCSWVQFLYIQGGACS